MGVDVYSGSGVICEVDQAVKFINGKNKSAVIEICAEFYNELVAESEKNPEDEWRKDTLKFFKPLKGFHGDKPPKMTIKQVQDAVASVVTVSGEPAKYDIDTHVNYSEEVADLFQKIIASYSEAMDVDVPYLEQVTAWGSSRYNGWDVPLGVACFVFQESDCYTKALSEEGKALKKVIGHCDLTEWTEFSC